MKRIGCFFLSFILVCSFLVVPCFASPVTNETLVNLLDYNFINPNNSSNNVGANSTSNYVAISLPYQSYISYFDIVFSSNFPIKSVKFRHTGEMLTVVNVGGTQYRAYGNVTPTSPTPHVAFDFIYETSHTSRNISFSYFGANLNRESFIYERTRSVFCVYHGSDSVERWLDESEVNYQYTVDQSVEGTTDSYTFRLGFPDWDKFDYIDVMLAVTGTSIPSLNVYLGEHLVPYEISDISSAVVPSDSVYGIDGITGDTNSYLISMRLYLSGFDRSIDNYPFVNFTVTFNTWSTVYYYGSFGCTYEKNVSPLYLFLRKIEAKLDSLVNGDDFSQESADSFQDSAFVQSNELSEMSAVMNSVEQPNLSGVNFDYGGMVSTDVVTLSTVGLSTALGNGIIVRLLVMVLTLAIAGYILYGKK